MVTKAASSTKTPPRHVSPAAFTQRRKQVAEQCSVNSVVILSCAPEVKRNADCEYPYRQNSNFYYLTGFEEPESIAVLLIDDNQTRYLLFCRERDPAMEVWVGARAGLAGAKADFSADESYPIATFPEHLSALLANRDKIYLPLGHDQPLDAAIIQQLQTLQSQSREGLHSPENLIDLKPIVAEMRLIKSADEIRAMETASNITVDAHIRAMQTVQPGQYEYELEAEIQHEFMSRGVRSPAYTSIVGAGANACVLHYIENNSVIADGDLVLIDAGAEVENYAADVTRTFPANGKFSEPQKAIYNLVLKSQLAAIAEIKPGACWSRMQDVVVDILVDGLIALGILTGDKAKLIEDKAYQRFYMHRSGHWLGLDVHDAGSYTDEDGKWRSLQPGMTLTVEPGLYISAEHDDIDPKWHNIGVRIEDDVLVTEIGANVLTEAAPKTVDAIEALMRKAHDER